MKKFHSPRVLIILFLFLIIPFAFSEWNDSSLSLKNVKENFNALKNSLAVNNLLDKADAVETLEGTFHFFFDTPLYCTAAALLGSAAILSKAVSGICAILPWPSWEGEFSILGQICRSVAKRSFLCGIKRFPLFSFLFKRISPSHAAWDLNKEMLSKIPVDSEEEEKLVHFLQKRWLGKMTGSYPILSDWLCPAFGISLQVHPDSTNSYARLISNKLSLPYKKTMQAYNERLPHPHDFPLILTLPSLNAQAYLPQYHKLKQDETGAQLIERLESTIRTASAFVIIDTTPTLACHMSDKKQWLDAWNPLEKQLIQSCHTAKLDLNRILCIQQIDLERIGGIRILPLHSFEKSTIDAQYQFLLERISEFGLTANPIEIDRSLLIAGKEKRPLSQTPTAFPSKEELLFFLSDLDQNWISDLPQKTLMFQAAVQVFKDLIASLPQEKWESIRISPTHSSAVQLYLKKIQVALIDMERGEKNHSFHDLASRIECIYADLASLLEIFSPFVLTDFFAIFEKHLSSIPPDLKPLSHYAIHPTCMTTLGAVLKAVEKTIGKPPRILFGENTYFECIHAVEHFAHALSDLNAEEQDWKEADLLLAQFNPPLKRIHFKANEYRTVEYHLEQAAQMLHHALSAREKPLTIALDCTIDFSNSDKLEKLLLEFQKEIQDGHLNVICYRSGIKFDLFGMDNYCGAPCFMIHNGDAKWSLFDAYLKDEALQTDRLSVNWFCLAFQNAAPYLEAYRKQIFDHTRAVLNKIPKRLFSKNDLAYRVIPVESDVDACFIDIKIFGPLHEMRSSMIVAGYLTIKCLEKGIPLLYRPGIGFYHPNLCVLFAEECSTIRLTLGLDPAQIDIIAQCLEDIDAMNGPVAI